MFREIFLRILVQDRFGDYNSECEKEEKDACFKTDFRTRLDQISVHSRILGEVIHSHKERPPQIVGCALLGGAKYHKNTVARTKAVPVLMYREHITVATFAHTTGSLSQVWPPQSAKYNVMIETIIGFCAPDTDAREARPQHLGLQV